MPTSPTATIRAVCPIGEQGVAGDLADQQLPDRDLGRDDLDDPVGLLLRRCCPTACSRSRARRSRRGRPARPPSPGRSPAARRRPRAGSVSTLAALLQLADEVPARSALAVSAASRTTVSAAAGRSPGTSSGRPASSRRRRAAAARRPSRPRRRRRPRRRTSTSTTSTRTPSSTLGHLLGQQLGRWRPASAVAATRVGLGALLGRRSSSR